MISIIASLIYCDFFCVDGDYNWSNVLSNVSLTGLNIINNELTFVWSSYLPSEDFTDAMYYSISSSNCGVCSNVTYNNSVTCLNYPQLSWSKSCLLIIAICMQQKSVTFELKGG